MEVGSGTGIDCTGSASYAGGGGVRTISSRGGKLGVGMLTRVSLASPLVMVRVLWVSVDVSDRFNEVDCQTDLRATKRFLSGGSAWMSPRSVRTRGRGVSDLPSTTAALKPGLWIPLKVVSNSCRSSTAQYQ